ncbi:MAG: N-acetylneuraminate synthase [Oceanospirillaceae bacterium]|nr:N-acetylneuraminate synthase [Oceanospirillaceae bacterium]
MTIIIAEVGVNHNGDVNLAIELIDAAKKCGADIVKFQTFNSSDLVNQSAKKADYQVKNTKSKESQLNMLQSLELSFDKFFTLSEYCKKLNIEFLSTAFDFDSLDFIVNKLNVNRLKIPSGELTNLPFVLKHAQTGLDLIVSTGMANLAEIEVALSVIAYGYTAHKNSIPCRNEFDRAYSSVEGQAALREKVTLLHCTTEYPAPVHEINLNAINTLRQSFKTAVGYSDHSKGVTIPTAAVALGAKIIEKHLTLDVNMDGPDHKASLEPCEFTNMVEGIREIERAMGNGIKQPFPSEIKNKIAARKSLIAKLPIKVGESFSQENITTMRPGSGMSPAFYWDVLKKKSSKSYQPGDLIDE